MRKLTVLFLAVVFSLCCLYVVGLFLLYIY